MKFFKIMRFWAAVIPALALVSVSESVAGIVNELPTIRINGNVLYYYDTQSGDNIYTIADKLGVSVEDIRTNNPSVSDGIKPRMRLFFPTDIKSRQTDDSNGPLTHVVVKGESIYGIARQHNLSMDKLLSLNPEAQAGIIPGMRLKLQEDDTEQTEDSTPPLPQAEEAPTEIAPVNDSEPLEVAIEETAIPDTIIAASDTVIAIPDTVSVTAEPLEMNVAIILPFLLQDETIGRQTQLYTEFYKGFLLAADSLNTPGRTKIKLHAYDSSANQDSVRAIMQRPEMAEADLIVAPDNISQLTTIARYAPTDALILNMFAVRDSSYTEIPQMVQTNIPHDAMYAHAIEGFLDRFPYATPVFISRMGGKTDKEEFTRELKANLSRSGRIYKTITFDGYLSTADFEDLDTSANQYVFIPVSGSRDEFSRFYHALKELKDNSVDPEAVKVFSYPEWATFRGDQFNEICNLNTTIYSRYLPIQNFAEAANLNDKFRQEYGEPMLNKQMPVLGILGFDTASMVINGLRSMAETGEFPLEYSGIQSGIRLVKANENGGYYNNALFIITYLPGGVIEKTLK